MGKRVATGGRGGEPGEMVGVFPALALGASWRRGNAEGGAAVRGTP